MRRLQELDVLRGFAALAVVAFHYTTLYGTRHGHTNDLIFGASYGHAGIELFFMISGFVIFMTLNRTDKPLDFIVSRFSRLFPAYWAAIAITFTTLTIFGLDNHTISTIELLVNFTMLQGFFGIENVDGSYWTLLYELFFYGIMFTLYLGGWLNRIESFCLLWLAAESIRLVCFLNDWPFSWKLQQLFILEYCHLFIAGIIFYRLAHTRPSITHYLILIICLMMQWFLNKPLMFSLVSIYFVVFYFIVHGQLSFIVNKPLVFLGTISYSLYLIHQVVGFIIIRELEAIGVESHFAVVLTLIFVIFLSHLMNVTIEKPSMKAIKILYSDWKCERLSSTKN